MIKFHTSAPPSDDIIEHHLGFERNRDMYFITLEGQLDTYHTPSKGGQNDIYDVMHELLIGALSLLHFF